MEMTLRGMVYAKYPTIAAFSKEIGWKRNKTSRIVNGTQQPSKQDMEDLIRTLEIKQADVAPVFFGSMFTE